MPEDKPIEANRILIIDDDAFMHSTLELILRDEGFATVESASESEQAIKVLNKQVFDLVIADIQIDSTTGLDILKIVRMGTTKSAPSIPFLLLSAHADEHIQETAEALDVNCVMVKPTTADDLLKCITNSLKHTLDVKSASHYERVDTTIDLVNETFIHDISFEELDNRQLDRH